MSTRLCDGTPVLRYFADRDDGIWMQCYWCIFDFHIGFNPTTEDVLRAKLTHDSRILHIEEISPS